VKFTTTLGLPDPGTHAVPDGGGGGGGGGVAATAVIAPVLTNVQSASEAVLAQTFTW
jgi:glycine cleavage system protein P-like pyridoxal-binding family